MAAEHLQGGRMMPGRVTHTAQVDVRTRAPQLLLLVAHTLEALDLGDMLPFEDRDSCWMLQSNSVRPSSSREDEVLLVWRECPPCPGSWP